MIDRISFDDFDWAGTGATDGPPVSAPTPAAPDEAPPPPSTPRIRGRRGEEPPTEYSEDLPPAYREYGAKNIYKRPKRAVGSLGKFDDFDWAGTGAPRTGGPAYNPADDWAVTRGFKAGEQGGGRAIKSSFELARISALPPEQQATEMLKLANTPQDPSDVQLQVPGVQDIDWSPGKFLTWLGESSGQMLGSMVAAGEYGGLPGAAVGAGVGGLAGATAGGIGAAPGAVAGGVAGFTSGSLAAYAGMGVGGLFDDLLHDEGVQRGLKDGSIDTNSLILLTTAGGLTIGALDAIPATKAVGRIGGKEAANLAKTTIKNAILRGARRGAKEEGTTEAIQGAISEVAQAYEGGDIDAGDRLLSVLNQGLVGAVGGASAGGISGADENRYAKPAPGAPGTYGPNAQPGGIAPGVGPGAPTPPAGGAPLPMGGGTTRPEQAAPASPPGLGIDATATPHAPAGGTHATAPMQPAGARTRPAAPPLKVEAGDLPLDIKAATAPAAPAAQPKPAGTGDATIDAVLSPQGPGTYAPPVNPPADPNISVTEGLPNYGVPQPPAPAPTPAPPPVPPPTPAPVPPVPPADFYRTGESAYQPGAAPAPGDLSQTEGLPRHEPIIEEPAPEEAPAEPALVEEPKPIPVTIAEKPEVRLNVPELKAEAAKQRPAKRRRFIEDQALDEQRIVEIGERLHVEDAADVTEAKGILTQFRDRPEHYRRYWTAFSKQLKDYLGPRWSPDYVEGRAEIAPERPLAAPRKRAKPYGRPKEPVARQRDVRPPVKIGEYKRPAVKPGKKVKKAAAVTREVFEAIKTKHGPKAHARLRGATVRLGEKVGRIIGVTQKEPAPIKAMERGAQPRPLRVTGKITTIRKIDKAIEEHEHAIRQLQQVISNPERMAAALARRRGATRQQVVDEMQGRIDAVRKKLSPLIAARKSDLYQEHERYARAHPAQVAAARQKIEEITPTKPETAFKLSFQKEPVTEEELFRDYQVERETEEIQQPEQKAPVLTTQQEILARLRKHFAKANARPVLLASLGIGPKQRRALEARGMAEKGAMDRGEFELYEASEAGVREPPPATIAPSGKTGAPKPKTTVDLFKPKPPSKTPAEERLGAFRWDVSPALDLETTPEKEAKIVGVSELQAAALAAEEATGLTDKPRLGAQADKRYITRVQATIAKLKAGVRTRNETFKDLLRLQQIRADAWLVQNRALEAAKTRMGAVSNKKAAPAIAKELKQTWKRRALAEKAKKPARRDPLRVAMLQYFDILSEYHNKEKSSNPREKSEAIREQAKANAALEKLHQRLVARAEKEDLARERTIAREAELESQRQQALEDEGQQVIDAYLREQVAEGVIDAELADALADKENRAYLQKYQKREQRQVVTTPALHNAVTRTKMPALPEAVEARHTRTKKFTRAERAASEAFAATLPERRTAGIDDPASQRIVGFKLPDWYLQQTRSTITAFVENMRRELYKARGKLRDLDQGMPIRTNPNSNTIEENFAIFVRQRLAVTGKPSSKRGVDETLGSFARGKVPTLTKPLEEMTKRERAAYEKALVAASQGYAAEQQLTAEEFEEEHGRPRNKSELAKYTAAQQRIFGKRGLGLGKGSKRGPTRFRAGAEEAMAQRGLAVRQRAHRTSNIHDAMQAMYFMQKIVEAKRVMARLRSPEKIARLGEQLQKDVDALNGIIFEHAAMSKFAPETEVEKPAKEDEAIGKGRPLGFSETAIRPMEGLEGSETSADLEAFEQHMEEAAAGFVAGKAESEKNAILEAKMALARRFEAVGYVATVNGRRVVISSPVTLPEGSVSREAMDLRPVGVPLRTLSGKQALNEWANKGQVGGWQRWLRGGLIRSLRTLVGDIDVHVVDGIYANNKAGMFVPGANPQILINREALGRPQLLADTIIHEMAHAATNYALHNNIRGTRSIVEALMRQLKTQLGDDLSSQSVEIRNAFKNADEFIAASADHAPFQDMLASLAPDRATRAQVRALGRGRVMPTYWDQVVAMVENAIGFFTPAGRGGSYMSQVLKIYPHVAMTLGEQARHAREGGEMPDANAILEHPLDPRNWGAVIRNVQQSNFAQWSKKYAPTDYLHKLIAEKHFGGDMVNPTTPLIDMLTMHPNLVTDEMAVGDKADEAMVAFVNEDRAVREPQIEAAYKDLADSVVKDIDVTRADNPWIWDDAKHPLKGGKQRAAPTARHLADEAKREMHRRGHAAWLAHPQAVRDIFTKRIRIMKTAFAKFEHDFTVNWIKMLMEQADHPLDLAAIGKTEADAVQEILSGNISKELKTALGDNYQTIKGMGRISRRDRLYVPLYRDGSHFISGRRDIATPTVTRGTVHLDQKLLDDSGRFEFVFSNEEDANDYIADIDRVGDERTAGSLRRETAPGKNTAGKPVNKPTGNWRVPMQDRFMMMGDDPAELSKIKDEEMATGEYRFISDPLQVSQKATLSGAMPLKLEKMLANIDTMSGRTEAEKAVMKSMARTMYVQTQQGNRITKRLLKRTGAYGYETGYESIRQSLRQNNEMTSRHIVALQRLPTIAKASKYLRDYTDAIARRGQPGAFDKLEPGDRARLTRNYGKLDADTGRQLRADVKIIEDRIEAMMAPKGAPLAPEKYWRAFTTAVVMNYLAGPSYTALQMISLPMFTWPQMVAEFSRTGSVSSAISAATKALYEAGTEIGSLGIYQTGAYETLMELNEVRKGFAPREGWMKHARTVRRSHDYMADMYARLRANGVPYAEEKITMFEIMRKRGAIGQAGLNQQNLQEDLLGPGMANKVLRGVKAGGKVFQAFQEAAEMNNRAVPAIAYFNKMVREGKSVAEAQQLAINNVSREQVNYAKENWPGIASAHGFSQAFMFKKFGAVQALNYWDALIRAFPGVTDDAVDAKAARVHIAAATLVLATLGGFSGNPLWEPLRMLNYLLGIFGLTPTTDWNELKTEGEKWMSDNLVGPVISEGLMYGATRALGIDLSGRIAMDNVLFYKQPAEMTPDDWYKTMGEAFLGAPGAVAVDAVVGINDIVNKAVWDEPGTATWGKDISKLPMPKVIKDIIKAAELMEYGPKTTTGVSTGDPIGLGTALVQGLGFRSRESSRPFEQGSAAQHRIEQNIDAERNTLMQSVTNRGYDATSMRQLRKWNLSHPGKNERITMKNLSMARKRRRKVELEIRRKNLEAA